MVGQVDERNVMSYDFNLCFPNSDNVVPETEMNMTGNLRWMWEDAGLPLRDYAYLGPDYGSEPCLASELVEPARSALLKLLSNPDRYSAMEPTNKWGRYHHAVEFVWHILKSCSLYPDAWVEISC